MSITEELVARVSPPQPLRVCPRCLLIDHHKAHNYTRTCLECGWQGHDSFPVVATKDARRLILLALRDGIENKDAENKKAALAAWAIISDDWEWIK